MFGKLNKKHALVIGAGEMAELSLLNLKGAGVSEITIINRTLSRAKSLADQYGVHYAEWDALGDFLVKSDIVISSTSSEQFIITQDMLEMCQAVAKTAQKYSLILLFREISNHLKQMIQSCLFTMLMI